MTAAPDLTGKLLVAMPGMTDPRFDRSVVFLCAYSEEGAMGLIVNKPAPELILSDILEQLEIDNAQETAKLPVYFGGPVETARGFVLHSGEYKSRLQTLEVDDDFGMTATLDVLEDLASGDGPQEAMVMLGYSGWGPGQLDSEIARNGWLVASADPKLVFGTDCDDKWVAAIKSLGIDPLVLSSTAGRA